MANGTEAQEWEAVLDALDDDRRLQLLWRYGRGNRDVAPAMGIRRRDIPFGQLSPVAQERWLGEARRLLASTSRRLRSNRRVVTGVRQGASLRWVAGSRAAA